MRLSFFARRQPLSCFSLAMAVRYFEFNAKQRWALEVKRSLGSPAPSKGFYIGCANIKATRQIVLYPGDEKFKLDARTEVMPLRAFTGEVMAEQAP